MRYSITLSTLVGVEAPLVLRLQGAIAAVSAAASQLGGERVDETLANAFWAGLREQTDEYFDAAKSRPLWRLSVPQAAAPLKAW